MTQLAESLKILSLIPPMTQLNTPYPATAYLTGFLRSRGYLAVQDDLALQLVLRLLSGSGLDALRNTIQERKPSGPCSTQFLRRFEEYRIVVDPVIRFLQGKDPTLAHRIVTRKFLPEGSRFASLDTFLPEEHSQDALAWAFGALGISDRARHFATLFLSDIADVIRESADPRFEFIRYAETLASSQPEFDPLDQALSSAPTLVDQFLAELTCAAIRSHRPQVVLLTVPFPGTVYGAFRIAQTIRMMDSGIVTVLGGGFVNTELRELTEPRVFDYFNYICLDDGERPLLALLEFLQGRRSVDQLVRTYLRTEEPQTGQPVVKQIRHPEPDVPFTETGTPTWDGLPLGQYLSTLDLLNPMHRLWSDGRWNKLTIAHGCYWKKCSFCDVTLDYIGRYDTAAAEVLADRIEAIVSETGQTGFHFVDEAAPPKGLKALAEELLRRKLAISWWGNIRFEKSFTAELCGLLAESGCIAISGGLEVASDRLLNLMKKGVSVAQVARVTRNFAEAGILVHAYLMYGFPTQTVQETVDALEYVRQLFAEGCIHSGFFHQFTCTVHSPVGQRPEDYGVTLIPLPPVSFARNDVGFIDPVRTDHVSLGKSLSRALYNFMHGVGLDQDVRSWFQGRMPRTGVPRNFVARALYEG